MFETWVFKVFVFVFFIGMVCLIFHLVKEENKPDIIRHNYIVSEIVIDGHSYIYNIRGGICPKVKD